MQYVVEALLTVQTPVNVEAENEAEARRKLESLEVDADALYENIYPCGMSSIMKAEVLEIEEA